MTRLEYLLEKKELNTPEEMELEQLLRREAVTHNIQLTELGYE